MGLKSTKVKYVELPHTDATAVPKDVKKGKVFYNNDGRQVGQFDDTINIDLLKAVYGNDVKAVMLNKNNMTNNSAYYFDCISLYDTLFYRYLTGSTTEKYVSNVSAKYNGNIIGFAYKGKTVLTEMSVSYQVGNASGVKDIDRAAFLIGASDPDVIIIQTKKELHSFWVKVKDTCPESITIFYK